ncbi:hypothetical protein Tsubulata_012786 [Turnera subulata]|uniref:MADS-box domain-containing protein n=1 Tax=Turnera subulata TaxID=218843 RepID=A0A9Q0FPG6_9ROSI|nr:hypothetical protein Tsubulata_012786 [Turnera subulata]
MKARNNTITLRETALQRSVSLSKRRKGLFSKAVELCKDFNLQVSIAVVTSPPPNTKKKAYLFGHSSPEAIYEAFIGGINPPKAPDVATLRKASSISEQIIELKPLVDAAIKEKKKKAVVPEMFWDVVKEISRSESLGMLMEIKAALESLLNKTRNKLHNSRLLVPHVGPADFGSISPTVVDSSTVDDTPHQITSNNQSTLNQVSNELEDRDTDYRNIMDYISEIACGINDNVMEQNENAMQANDQLTNAMDLFSIVNSNVMEKNSIASQESSTHDFGDEFALDDNFLASDDEPLGITVAPYGSIGDYNFEDLPFDEEWLYKCLSKLT